MKKTLLALCCMLVSILTAVAQEETQDTLTMSFEEYNPTSTLVVPENPVKRAKFPFVDIHSHQYNMPEQDLSELVATMDTLNMGVMVNLSGRGFKRSPAGFDVNGPEHLQKSMEKIRQSYPDRFVLFTNIAFTGIGKEGWTEKAVRELEEDVKNGAQGLKIYKSLGLSIKDINGERVPVNHPQLDPIWAKCGELGIPVLIHSADPKPFWDSLDADNERWLELKTRPNRKRSETDPAPWEQIIMEQHDVFARHANTRFINAHMGWYANNLDKLGQLLDMYPNMYVGIGAIIAELGRQPRQARVFFIQYQDRILFGKDSWQPDEFPTYFRVLETADEYFPYHKKYHAFWRMYGLDLPDEVLRKIYYKNALTLLPGMDASIFEN